MAQQVKGLDPGGVLAPASKVDPRVWSGFDTRARQLVIVAVSDPAPAVVQDPGPGYTVPTAPAEGERKARVAVLAYTKQSVLASLGKAALEPVHVRSLYESFSLMALHLTADQVATLARHKDVVRILPDELLDPDVDSSLPFVSADEILASGHTGAGVAVAVLDDAVQYWNGDFGTCPSRLDWADHSPGCAIAVWKNFNGYTGAPGDLPEDEPHHIADTNGGHGTHVAGIVHAIAPDAAILALNVFYWSEQHNDFKARASDIIAALDWVAQNAATYNVRVANMSNGTEHHDARPCNFETNYYEPIRSLWADHEVVTVISSGNDAHANWVKKPGCVSLAVTVAAQHDTSVGDYATSICTQLDPREGEVACFSNLNGMLDLVAPGRWITIDGVSKTGTSMAAPHVAGGLAALQSAWQAEGAFEGAPAAVARLQARATSVAHNGLVFPQLDLAGGFDWELHWGFPRYFREDDGARIPLLPDYLELNRSVAGEGWSVAGLYLLMEVAHPSPQDVQVTLVSPNGTQTTFALPAGGSNFNAMIGRDYLPGFSQVLAGQPVDGQWSLRLSDTVVGNRGHYLSAVPYWVRAPCTPDCPPNGCGHDRCGGACGTCAAGQLCAYDRTCVACVPDCSGRTCGSDRCGGTCGRCDDGLFCNGAESCVDSTCQPGDAPCSPDAIDCTRTCDESTQLCNQAAEPGTCFIDGACHLPGAIDPANPCRECDPARSSNGWSADDTNPCFDATVCRQGGVCVGGSCQPGPPLDCSHLDGVCVAGTCNPADGTCGTATEPDGTPCDDGDACTGGESCEAGVCLGGTDVCSDGGGLTDGGASDNGSGGCSCGLGGGGRGPLGLLSLLGFVWLLRRGRFF